MKISIEHVKGVVTNSYKEGKYRRLRGRENIAIFIRHIPLKSGSKQRIGYNSYEIKNESYLVFIDLMYQANFAHPVVYELHNVEDGSVRSIEEKWPIADLAIERSLVPLIISDKEPKEEE